MTGQIRYRHELKYYTGAFLLPVLIALAAFGLNGMYPFGNRSIMVCDGIKQYLPFHEALWQRLFGRGSDAAIHSVFSEYFFGIFAYYLASPFTILAMIFRFFFHINEAVTIIIFIKIGCISCAFMWYAGKTTGLSGQMRAAFGTMYALSDFVLGYYVNLMWLDALILLPFLAYGIEELILEERWKRYFFVLIAAMITNYYTGYMLGVFGIIYFLSVLFEHSREKCADQYKNYIRISLGAAGISCCWLLPVAFSLQYTTAGLNTHIFDRQVFLGNMIDTLARLKFTSVPLTKSTDQSGVNLFCGSLSPFFIIGYIIGRSRSRRIKAAVLGPILIYLAGLWICPLNLLFHGFHKPIGMPNRFAFIVIFLLLRPGMRVIEESGVETLKNTKSISLLAAFLIIDVSSHALWGVSANELPAREPLVERSTEIQELIKNTDQQGDYRTIMTEQKFRNEELLNNINGLSLYSSTISEGKLVRMAKMGALVRNNMLLYQGNSELMNLIFGVKYLIVRRGSVMQYSSYEKVKMSRNFMLLHNAYALEAGNTIEKQVMNAKWSGKNVFDIHEQILSYFGCDHLYDLKRIYAKKAPHRRCGLYYEIPMKKGEHTYLHILGSRPRQVWINGVKYTRKNCNTSFIDLGYSDEDRVAAVFLPAGKSSRAIVGSYPQERMEKIAQELREVCL